MKRVIAIVAAALLIAGLLSSCASFNSMSTHSGCQAQKANNHAGGRMYQ